MNVQTTKFQWYVSITVNNESILMWRHFFTLSVSSYFGVTIHIVKIYVTVSINFSQFLLIWVVWRVKAVNWNWFGKWKWNVNKDTASTVSIYVLLANSVMCHIMTSNWSVLAVERFPRHTNKNFVKPNKLIFHSSDSNVNTPSTHIWIIDW